MKKILMLILVMLLTGCNKMTRTDVIDHLIDNGYSRNQANFYEKYVGDYTIRIGYRKTITGYLESLRNLISPGPIILIDVGNNVSFNYHFNQDAMLYSILCVNSFETQTTEMMYYFDSDEFVIGVDNCEFDNTKEEEYIEEFKMRKETVMRIMDELALDKKKLDLLGE